MLEKDIKPFDSEVLLMIDSVLKTKCSVWILDNGNLYVKAPAIGTSLNVTEALRHALKGKLSDRLVDFHVENTNVIIQFEQEPEEYPDRITFEISEPLTVPNISFERKPKEVEAMLVERSNAEIIAAFVGGGFFTIPRTPGALAEFTFPTQNGVMLTVREGEYIVLDNGNFYKMTKRDFEIDFQKIEY